jgi:hypothetical protein
MCDVSAARDDRAAPHLADTRTDQRNVFGSSLFGVG